VRGAASPQVKERFIYYRPASLDEAVDLLGNTDGEVSVLAGGTDLSVAIRHSEVHPRMVIDLKAVPELAPGIAFGPDSCLINANTPLITIERDQEMRCHYPGLVEAVRTVGSVLTRNRATLAGNICNASPAADTPPMLMAMGAEVVTSGIEGERVIPLDAFLTGYRKTALKQGELVRAVSLPRLGRRAGTAFLKLGIRKAMEISVTCVGTMIGLADDGAMHSAGIALGSVAPRTVRANPAEELLVGSQPTPMLFADAGRAAMEVAEPIDDLRASAEYRMAMVPILVERALATASRRAQDAP
jgi:carbon-monoxide dehydrogenase medium subunit